MRLRRTPRRSLCRGRVPCLEQLESRELLAHAPQIVSAAADWNHDGAVDFADLVPWERAFGAPGLLASAANGSGLHLGGSELLAWQRSVGTPRAAAAQLAPVATALWIAAPTTARTYRVEWLSGAGGFQELGLVVADDAQGTLGGLAPSESGYAYALAEHATRLALLDADDATGTTFEFSAAGGPLWLYVQAPGIDTARAAEHLQVVAHSPDEWVAYWEESPSILPGVFGAWRGFDDAVLRISAADDCPPWVAEGQFRELGGSAAARGAAEQSGCRITLTEGDSFQSQWSTRFDVPSAPSALTLSWDALTFDTSADFVNDALEVALLDAQGNSLVRTVGRGHDALLNLTEGQAPQVAPGVELRADGMTVGLQGMPPGTLAELVVRWVNNDGDSGGSVAIVDVDLQPAALVAVPPGGPTRSGFVTNARSEAVRARQASGDWAAWEEITADLAIDYAHTSLNDAADQLRVELAVRNVTERTLTGPLWLAVDGLTDPAVQPLDPVSRTPQGAPLFDASAALSAEGLPPGEQSAPVALTFAVPARRAFQYELRAFAPRNRPPAFVTAPRSDAVPGRRYSYPAEARDPDDDAVRYRVTVGPAGLVVDPASGAVRWTPTVADRGAHQVTLRAEDGRGGFDEQRWTIHVGPAPLNRPPVIVDWPSTTAYASTTTAAPTPRLEVTLRDLRDDHPDFEAGIGGWQTGLVAERLGADGTPVLNEPFGRGFIQDAESFYAWFHDVPGVNTSLNRELPLTETVPGSGIYEFVDDAFFPLDDQLFGNQGRAHNYHFTLQASADFVYRGGETFAFTGDDDVWVFVDRRLAVDLGGVKDALGGAIALDDLGLEPGQTYPIDFFFAERHTFQSRFRLTTSIDLAGPPAYLQRVAAIDPEDDPLRFELLAGPAGMTLHPTTGVLAWSPTSAQVGEHRVAFRVTDAAGAAVEHEFVLCAADDATAVNPVPPAPPMFTSTPPNTAYVDGQYAYRLAAQSPESESLEFRLREAPAGMQLQHETLRNALGQRVATYVTAVWNPPATMIGSRAAVAVDAIDAAGRVTTQRWSIQVEPRAEQNRAPVWTAGDPPRARRGAVWGWELPAADPDGGRLTYALIAGPAGMTLDSAGALTWQTPPDADEVVALAVAAHDAHGVATQRNWSLGVVDFAENAAPRIDSAPPRVAVAGETYRHELEGSDDDVDPLRWRLLAGPRGMSIDPQQGTLRWEPDANQRGAHPVAIEARDPWGASATQRFIVQVECTNTAPLIRSFPLTEAVVDRDFPYAAQAVDREGDPLAWSLVAAPAGMTVDRQTGELRWRPNSDQAGRHMVELIVADAQGSTRQTWEVEVYRRDALWDPHDPALGTRGNRLPEIASTPPLHAEAGVEYRYDVQALDRDGSALAYRLAEAPLGMTIDPLRGVVRWTPTSAHVGAVDVRVAVEDGQGGAAYQAFRVEVVENLPPAVVRLPSPTAVAGAPYRGVIVARDPEGLPLTYRLVAAPEGMTLDAAGRLAWTPQTPRDAPYPVTIEVADPFGRSTRREFSLVVGPDLQPPRVSLTRIDADGRPTAATTIAQGASFLVQARASDNTGQVAAALSVGGRRVPLDAQGRASLQADLTGDLELRAVARDAAGLETVATLRLTVVDPAAQALPLDDARLPVRPPSERSDERAPRVVVASPTGGQSVSQSVAIVGVVDDPEDQLWFYRAYAGRLEEVDLGVYDFAGPGWQLLHEGTDEVLDGPLATFDATLADSGPYVLAVVAYDALGQAAVDAVVVYVDGELELGNFALETVDLELPLVGVPIAVMRAYDSLDADVQAEFGRGWRMSIGDGELVEAAAVGPGGALNPGNDKFLPGVTKVYLTNPDGRRVGFTYHEELVGAGFFGGLWRPSFVPDPGVYDQLSIDETEVVRGGAAVGLVQGTNPAFYTLTTPAGWQYRYRDDGRLQHIVDLNGNRVEFRDDAIVHSTGAAITLRRDHRDRVVEIVDPLGASLRYAYDAEGRLTTFVDQTGDVVRYEYREDRPGILERAFDERGALAFAAQYEIDAGAGRTTFTGVFDAAGVRIDLRDYDRVRNRETVQDALGRITTYVYDDRGNTLEEVDPLGQTRRWAYDDPRHPDLPTRLVDRNGNVSEFAYDARANLVEQRGLGSPTRPLDPPLTAVFAYDAGNRLIRAIDPLGRVTTLEYDPRGNLVRQTNAAGDAFLATYDELGRVLTATDFGGQRVTYAYDEACFCGSPAEITFADGAFVTYRYDAYGGVVEQAVHEADGTLVQYLAAEFDEAGRLLRRQLGRSGDPEHPPLVVMFAYEGELLDWVAHAAPEAIGPDGRLQESPATPLDERRSRIVDYQYDVVGRLVRQVEPGGAAIEYRYDAAGNLVALADPIGNVTTWSYDAVDRPLVQIDPQHNRHADGRPLTIDEALAALPDAAGASCDAAPVTVLATTTCYDGEGNALAQFDALGRRMEWDYDHVGRVVEQRWFAPTGGEAVDVHRFTYDAVGNPTAAENRDSVFVLEFDRLDRIVRIAGGARIPDPELPRELHYAYDAVGNVVEIRDEQGVAVASTYDEGNRLTARRWTLPLAREPLAAARDAALVELAYDAADQPTAIRRWSGADELALVSETLRTYDIAGRADRLAHHDPAGRILAAYDYAYDFGGLPTGEQRLHQLPSAQQTIVYRHDLTGQLIDALFSGQDDEQFRYDAAGNRVSAVRGAAGEQPIVAQSTIGSANRLLADGRYRYEYDAVGNLVKQVSLAEAADPGAVRIFAYDHLNRMVRAEVWSRDPQDPAQPAAGAALEAVTAYTYDAWGRRIAWVADADGQGPAPAQRTAVAYEGVAAWAETFDGRLTVRYLHGAGVDELWATADAAGAVAWRLTDRLQTVRDVLDADGRLLVRHEYTTYGEPLPNATPQEADAVGGERFAFVGREWDEVSQAYFYRTRMYAPQAGRFTTVDGLGFEAGDFHLYRYVHNQPNHLVDPFGEAVFSERQAMKRIQLAMHQMVKCLGEVARDQFDTVGLYVLITNVAARGAGGGLANIYAGKTTNIIQRLLRHRASGVGGRGLEILNVMPIKLPRRVVENPKLLRIAEQILIEAFGGKESLHNTINAKRGLPC